MIMILYLRGFFYLDGFVEFGRIYNRLRKRRVKFCCLRGVVSFYRGYDIVEGSVNIK